MLHRHLYGYNNNENNSDDDDNNNDNNNEINLIQCIIQV